ncbi:MAG: hypothetical protein ACK559_16490 [bacterium]
MSISSFRRSTTDIGGQARARGPSYVSILTTVLVFPEGSATTASPGSITPDTTCPAKPR